MVKATPLDCALGLLARRDHAEAELRLKLARRGYPEDAVRETLERLKELRYLDDRRFARLFTESFLRNGRGFGPRLKMELARRGVAAEIVRETLAELPEGLDDEAELLERTIERRFPGFIGSEASDRDKRRVVSYLQRKGFSLAAILGRLKLHST